jgi:hypothetical protein
MRRLACIGLLAIAALGALPPASARAEDKRAAQVEDTTQLERHAPRPPGQTRRERWRSLSPEQRREARAAMRERVARFRSLPPEEQQRLRERFVKLRSLDPEQRARLEANRERWRSLPPAERERLRGAWRRLRDLPPEQRQRVLERALAETAAPE